MRFWWVVLTLMGLWRFGVAQAPEEPAPVTPDTAAPVPLQPIERGQEAVPFAEAAESGAGSPSERLANARRRKKRPFSFKFEARGSLSLVYQVGTTVQGGPEGERIFRNDYFGMTKAFNPFGALNWDWQIGNLRLQGDWTPFSYSPMARRLLAEYNAGSTRFTFGNLSMSLQGNQFVSFSRYAQGLQIKHQLGKTGDLTVVTFETPSQVITETFAGKNSPGPYFLRSSPIIEGSEQVRVDERPLRRGVDYQIDYSYGQLMFATPIPPTSTIAVSYETVGSGGVGRFVGARANLRTGDNSLLGITFLTQQVPFSITSNEQRHRREEFQGNGTVGPFLLQTRPIVTGTERVFVNGIQQTRDVHYRIDYQTGLVTFLQPVPVGALVVVEYDQAVGAIAQVGALRLLGLDWGVQLAALGRVSLQFGHSAGVGRNGTATEIALSNERRRFAYSLRWRRISPGFTRIDNTDFFRSESGLFADLRYDLLPGLTLTSQWQDSRSRGRLFFGPLGTSTGSDASSESTNRNLGLQLTFDRPKLPRLQLSHQHLSTGFGGTESAKTLTTAYLSHQMGHLTLEGAWEHSRDRSETVPTETNAPLTVNRITTSRRRFSVAYRPGSKLTALLDWTHNASNSSQQQFNTEATQRVFQLSYTPWQSLQLSFTHQRLSGGSSVSALLGGSYLTGVAGGGLSGIGFGGGFSGWNGSFSTTGFGGYGTFGVGTTPFPSSSGTWTPLGSASAAPPGWVSPSASSGWTTTPSWTNRSRQLPLPLPQPLPSTRVGTASAVTSFTAQWTPFRRLSLALDWTTNADKGSTEVGTLRQRALNLNGMWQISDRLSLFAQFGRDRTSDLSQKNESLTLTGLIGLTWGRYDGLNLTLSLQRLRMQTLRLATPLPQLDETTYTALALSAQLPIAGRWMTSLRAAWLQNRSPAGLYGGQFRNLELEAELTYRLTRNIGFSLIWTRTRRSGEQAAQNYSASLLRASLTANF